MMPSCTIATHELVHIMCGFYGAGPTQGNYKMKKLMGLLVISALLNGCGGPSPEELAENPDKLLEATKECLDLTMKGEEAAICQTVQEAQKLLAHKMIDSAFK